MEQVSVTAVVIRAVQVLLVSLRPSFVRSVSAGICFSLRDVLTRTERTLLFLGESFFSLCPSAERTRVTLQMSLQLLGKTERERWT